MAESSLEILLPPRYVSLTFMISLMSPMMVCDLPVPGAPCRRQTLGMLCGYCAASAMVEMALFCS